ncbi:unnamed protein product [Closterium sp. NIES-65]|nr:unnamed protein product [Closterium sp. NIES-65]
MGTAQYRFLLALVVASLNLLAVFAALPPDGYYEASEISGLEEAYDARALFEADNEAAVDSVDWVESDNSEDPRILADVAADLTQSSDGASGSLSAKKSPLAGQAGTTVRAGQSADSAASPNGKSIAARHKKGKQGKRKHCVRRRRGRCVKWAATKHRHTRTTKKTTGDLKTADRASAKPKGAESDVPAVGKKGAAPVSTFESTLKKGAGGVSSSGADSNSGAAPQPRALLEADTDASLETVDPFDSVEFEDPRVLRTVEDFAADLKRSSDDLSGAVKDSLGQAGRNVRNSFDRTFHTGRFAPKRGRKHHGGRKHSRGSATTPNRGGAKVNLGADPKTPAAPAAGKPAPGTKPVKGNLGTIPKTPAAPAAGKPAPGMKPQGAKGNSGGAPKLPGAPAAGTSGGGNKPGKGNSGAAPKLPTAPAAGKPGGAFKPAVWRGFSRFKEPLLLNVCMSYDVLVQSEGASVMCALKEGAGMRGWSWEGREGSINKLFHAGSAFAF